MNLRALPDIAGMLILMGVLDWLRRKYRHASVDLWMVGLLFVLIEVVAVTLFRGVDGFPRAAHLVALDAYVLAAVAFGWAAREDLLPGRTRVPIFFLPALPIFALTSMYGLDFKERPYYLAVAWASLVAGVLIFALVRRASWRFRGTLLGLHLAMWVPTIVLMRTFNLRVSVYWALACLYALVALSFRSRIRRGGIGGAAIVLGFGIWAMCFAAHPFLERGSTPDDLVEGVLTMQKFLVIIGMLLVLLEEQTRAREMEAMHDALTGLPNRRLFEDRLAQSLERARRNGRSMAVFAIDLNHFKLVNDTFGHRAGDDVLAQAGDRLRSRIRASDTLARCGGDEFNVIVNDLSRREDCERIADALRKAIAEVVLPANATAPLGVSIGFALYPDDVSDAGELCELADVRMYADKRSAVRQWAQAS